MAVMGGSGVNGLSVQLSLQLVRLISINYYPGFNLNPSNSTASGGMEQNA